MTNSRRILCRRECFDVSAFLSARNSSTGTRRSLVAVACGMGPRFSSKVLRDVSHARTTALFMLARHVSGYDSGVSLIETCGFSIGLPEGIVLIVRWDLAGIRSNTNNSRRSHTWVPRLEWRHPRSTSGGRAFQFKRAKVVTIDVLCEDLARTHCGF